MSYQIIHSDCKEAIRELIAKGIQVDSIVTDPPYELGFMGKAWDATGIANDVELWELALQVLKPGGHLLAFSGSRTYHRMTCAIEDAGFEIRDQIMWVYGQGFPKSLDISKAIDKMEGAEREVIGVDEYRAKRIPNGRNTNQTDDWNYGVDNRMGNDFKITNPATDLAKQWDGWGSALKPAHEPICMARKPLSEKNIASNVIKHGTGAINIDGCRVGFTSKEDEDECKVKNQYVQGTKGDDAMFKGVTNQGHYNPPGRFPANLIHDGSEEVEEEFKKYGERPGMSGGGKHSKEYNNGMFGKIDCTHTARNDKGSASRFFYSAKASKQERNGSKHPTVKPISLMKYLCKLVTPPGGTILDPFAGSGTTGQAAIEQDFQVILIEKESEYVEDIKKRMENIPLTFWQMDKLNELEISI